MAATPVEPGYAVAAVDGTEEGYAAVSFAAKESLRHGIELRLAHVMPASIPLRPLLMPPPGLGSFASETLASAARLASDIAPQLTVTTHVLMGGRVSEIVDIAEHATFVVVGRRHSGALDRAWSGGTLDGVVSRARCPVYVVPDVSRDDDDRPPRVCVGLKSGAHSAELFEAGFRAAEELGAELQVLHAWRLSSGYDDMIARRVSEPTRNREEMAAVRHLLAPWQEAYPGVRVRVRVVHEYPVRALIEASREADRLILVKPLHGSLLHHLGRTARGALRFAECPVEVIPAHPHGGLTMAPVAVEEAGELVP